MANIPVVGSLVGVLVLYLVVTLLRFGSRAKHLPPGPPTVPILGNAHLLMGENIHHKLLKWGKEYGSVYSLKIGKGTMIILNSKRAVYDLVDKRGAIYSGKPFVQQNIDVMHGENLGLIDQTPLWKAQRKMVVQSLTPAKLDGDIAKIYEAEISVLMRDLLDSPQDFKAHIKRCGASAAAISVYGQRARTNDDFWATAVYEGSSATTAALTPGSYLPVEHFPLLKLIPRRWQPDKHRAAKAYTLYTSISKAALDRVEQRRQTHGPRNSLLDRVLDGKTKPDVPMHGSCFVNFFATVWGAAADTSVVAVLSNLRYLAANPEVQRKAQAELDEVCGVDRAPVWADFERVPYVNCIVKEGLRIQGVAPMGLPHRVTQDDWYDDMLIPRDATIVISPYVLGRSQFPNPDAYDPDRYRSAAPPLLASDYAASSNFEARDHYAYGAGRRICAGIPLAERTQWRVFAKVLWAFDVVPGVDARTGRSEVVDTEAFENNFLPFPKEYRVRFVPRSGRHVEVLRRDAEGVVGFLRGWE